MPGSSMPPPTTVSSAANLFGAAPSSAGDMALALFCITVLIVATQFPANGTTSPRLRPKRVSLEAVQPFAATIGVSTASRSPSSTMPEVQGRASSVVPAWPAHLPRLHELRPGQPLSAFMDPAVPSAVRTAALRHMWQLEARLGDADRQGGEATTGLDGDPGFGPMVTPPDMVQDVHATMAGALLQLHKMPRQEEDPGASNPCSVRLDDPAPGDPCQ